MKYIVTIFWAFVIGEVVAFIGAKLLNVNDNAQIAAIVSVLFGIFVIILERASMVQSEK